MLSLVGQLEDQSFTPWRLSNSVPSAERLMDSKERLVLGTEVSESIYYRWEDV